MGCIYCTYILHKSLNLIRDEVKFSTYYIDQQFGFRYIPFALVNLAQNMCHDEWKMKGD